MKKEQIENWCAANNYLLVDLRKKHIPINQVIEIACNSTGIKTEQFKKTNSKPETAFARFLASTYFERYYIVADVSKICGFNHSMVSYARNLLSNWEDDLKFFKSWQQEAIKSFYNKIKEIETAQNVLQKAG